MKKQPVSSPWPSIVILLAFVVAGVAQCMRPTRGQTSEDVCGGKNSRLVTIGGSMVIGCR